MSKKRGDIDWEKKECPYCGRRFIVGTIIITGEKYKCIYCKIWFEYKDGKLIKIDYMKIK